MKKNTTKDTETHPIREFLGLSYQRWNEVNLMVQKTIRDSETWSTVLLKLADNPELTGVELPLAGGIFAELQMRKLRNVPPEAGLSHVGTPVDMHLIGSRARELPLFRTLEYVGLSGDELPIIRYVANIQPKTGTHLAEMLSKVYPAIQHLRPIGQVSGGFLAVGQSLLSAVNGDRWTVFTGQDAQWHDNPQTTIDPVRAIT